LAQLPLIFVGHFHKLPNCVAVRRFSREPMASRDLHQKIGRSAPCLIRRFRHAASLAKRDLGVGSVPYKELVRATSLDGRPPGTLREAWIVVNLSRLRFKLLGESQDSFSRLLIGNRARQLSIPGRFLFELSFF
jgi:hypothetical protein